MTVVDGAQCSTADLIASGLLEIGDGYRAKNVELSDEGLPFARAQNLSAGFDFEGADLFPVSSLERVGSKVSRPGDCVFTSKGSVGRVGFVSESTPRFVYSPQLSYWRSLNSELIDPPFLRYWLLGPEFTVQRDAVKGSTDMADYVNLRDQRRMKITLPQIEIQRKISSILSAYDDLIENNNRRIKLLEEMAQRIYREWFVDFRYPGHEAVPLVDSELGQIPEGWTTCPLSDLVSTQYGYTESATSKPIGPRFLRGMDINKTSYVDWSTVPYCPIGPLDLERYRLVRGDVLVIRMADPGKVGIVEQDVDAVFASYLIRVRPVDARIDPYVLFYFMSSNQYQSFVSGASTGTTRKSLSAPLITSMSTALPPQVLQQLFVSQVAPLRDLVTALVNSNTTLRNTRDILLPRLVSGEIDVADLDIALAETAT